jgi:hypothetical protein
MAQLYWESAFAERALPGIACRARMESSTRKDFCNKIGTTRKFVAVQ